MTHGVIPQGIEMNQPVTFMSHSNATIQLSGFAVTCIITCTFSCFFSAFALLLPQLSKHLSLHHFYDDDGNEESQRLRVFRLNVWRASPADKWFEMISLVMVCLGLIAVNWHLQFKGRRFIGRIRASISARAQAVEQFFPSMRSIQLVQPGESQCQPFAFQPLGLLASTCVKVRFNIID